jgi:galactose mutarotase-like enzyme
VTLQSSELSCAIVPELGLAVVSLLDLSTGAEALWRRPGFTPSASDVRLGPAGEPSTATFFNSFLGGWFEMFPAVGTPAAVSPDTYTHGEAVRLAWEVVDLSDTALEARVETPASRFALWRRLSVSRNVLRAQATVTNLGADDAAYAWGHHPCLARTTFAGGRIELSAAEAWVPAPHSDARHAVLACGPFDWPRGSTRSAAPVDVSIVPPVRDDRLDHICLRLRRGVVRIGAPRHDRALVMEFDVGLFPYLLIWQDFRREAGPGPAEGRDTVGVEFSSIPGRSMDDGAQAGALGRLAPGATLATEVRLSWSPLAP